MAAEIQLTDAPCNHILTNVGCFTRDGQWTVYDVRSDREGAVFDGSRIEMVNVETRQVRVLYESKNGACCGVAGCSPTDDRVVFILGPENPTNDWRYSACHRQGAVVRTSQQGAAENLDARDIIPPFTPGALRGGTHVHVFSGDGRWVSFTYNDHMLSKYSEQTDPNDVDLRNVGVCAPLGPVKAKPGPRNHDGAMFSVLVTRTTAKPKPGSDEISKAFEDAWVGVNGYVRADGTRQTRAVAFQGQVLGRNGKEACEVFIADIPDDVTVPGPDGPLEGTATRRPAPPRGAVQRRLTRTTDREYPGIQGPRHWLRSSPDGSRIAYLASDDAGVVQIWTVSPNSGPPTQVTSGAHSVASAFTWSPDGKRIAYAADNSIFVADVASGVSTRMTPRSSNELAPLGLSAVFSPDGRRIAYLRRVPADGKLFNQVFVLKL